MIMSRAAGIYPQALKFVVVGDPSSGKTTLVRRFLLDFGGDDTHNQNDTEKGTYACDGHTIVLNATVKHVRKDGSSVALKDCDVARQLWHNKISQSKSLPKKFQVTPEHWNDISWDEIFVYLHKLPSSDHIGPGSARKQHRDRLAGGHEGRIAPVKPPRSYGNRRTNEEKIKSSQPGKMLDKSKTEATEILVDIWDTVGDKSLMWHRWYACTGADAILLCVPLSLILSFNEMPSGSRRDDNQNDILDTLQKFIRDEFLSDKTKRLNYRVPPVLLVGTLSDQCELVSNRRRSVFEIGEMSEIESMGLKLAAEIGCCDFVYCSGLRGNGVASVFEAAVAVSLTSNGKYRASNISAKKAELDLSDCESSMSGEVACPTYFKVHTFPRNETKASMAHDEVFDQSSSSSECSDFDTDTLKPKRPPPQIFFPPPPDTSPPSTLPNSSDSSFEYTESLKSTDSINEADLANEVTVIMNQRLLSQRATSVSTQSLFINERPDRSPLPVPRKRILSENKVCKKPTLSSLTGGKHVSVEPNNKSLPGSQSPIPKPRRNRRTERDSRVDKSRRDSIFLKFLQAK